MVPSSSLYSLYPSIVFAFESFQTCQVIFSLGSLELFIFLLCEPVLSHLALEKVFFFMMGKFMFRFSNPTSYFKYLLLYTFCRHFLAGMPCMPPSRRTPPPHAHTHFLFFFQKALLKELLNCWRLTISSCHSSLFS